MEFQSTHPARGATEAQADIGDLKRISIHAPREGCDPATGRGSHLGDDFNPRTPRGVRQLTPMLPDNAVGFQSTHPARGATQQYRRQRSTGRNFNPRTPRGVRLKVAYTAALAVYFNPRTPRGVRQSQPSPQVVPNQISIHAPREGCDQPSQAKSFQHRQFQSTHPARGATANFTKE